MTEIKAPSPIPKVKTPKLFLAGSIEMGSARPWQKDVVEKLRSSDIVILNPRRDDWDSSWIQDKENPAFHEQVEWELDAMEQSDYILFYFDPETKSPISMMEEGLFARSGKAFIVCPHGFWKKGNIDIVCEKYHIPQFDSIDEALRTLTTLL